MSTIAKADHEILLTWREATGVVLHAPKNMKRGETVHCYSKRGEAQIEFFDNGSPFGSKKTKITSKEPPLELKAQGDFKARCYIATPKRQFIYKRTVNGGGGGNMHVS
jgi:hypothetical protein